MERSRKEETKHNIFISGIPITMKKDMSNVADPEVDDDTTADPKLIIHHILNFICPGIEENDYKLLKSVPK